MVINAPADTPKASDEAPEHTPKTSTYNPLSAENEGEEPRVLGRMMDH